MTADRVTRRPLLLSALVATTLLGYAGSAARADIAVAFSNPGYTNAGASFVFETSLTDAETKAGTKSKTQAEIKAALGTKLANCNKTPFSGMFLESAAKVIKAAVDAKAPRALVTEFQKINKTNFKPGCPLAETPLPDGVAPGAGVPETELFGSPTNPVVIRGDDRSPGQLKYCGGMLPFQHRSRDEAIDDLKLLIYGGLLDSHFVGWVTGKTPKRYVATATTSTGVYAGPPVYKLSLPPLFVIPANTITNTTIKDADNRVKIFADNADIRQATIIGVRPPNGPHELTILYNERPLTSITHSVAAGVYNQSKPINEQPWAAINWESTAEVELSFCAQVNGAHDYIPEFGL